MDVPAHIANRARRGIAEQAGTGIGTAMPPYISIMGNRFTLFDAAGNSRPVETFDPALGPILDCIIVDANQHPSRIFYVDDYDKDNPAPPDCFSDNGVGPSISASSPQHAVCEGCPQSKWGSKVSKLTGDPIPACSMYKKLAVFIPTLPGYVFQLRVPPKSLKDKLKKYMEKFRGQKFDLPDVYTRIRFEPGINGVLVFEESPLGFVDRETVTKCDQIDQTMLDNLVGRTDTPINALPAPKAAPQIASVPAGSQVSPGTFGAPVANVGPAPQPAFGVPQQAPVPAKRGRGRPPKNADVQPPATFASGGGGGMFIADGGGPTGETRPFGTGGGGFGGTSQPAPTGAAPFRPAVAQSTSPGGAPPAANPELEKALANAFGLPTQ